MPVAYGQTDEHDETIKFRFCHFGYEILKSYYVARPSRRDDVTARKLVQQLRRTAPARAARVACIFKLFDTS
ncbi:hypothetical protein EVAR_30464_1 [Eumeta japonica]|uniref:Uncharacterized protein n=1 Tax=Eumeta variegata TaxID=151549 RepID=A0A4C1W093_EUMVA|nr:hypothetical protein EVAR_30464_1 [Eumeta japonica]